MAVAAADKAFPAGKNTVPRERGKRLLKIAEAIQARGEERTATPAFFLDPDGIKLEGTKYGELTAKKKKKKG